MEEKLAEQRQPNGRIRKLLLQFCTPALLETCILTFVAGENLCLPVPTALNLQSGVIGVRLQRLRWPLSWIRSAFRSVRLRVIPSARAWLWLEVSHLQRRFLIRMVQGQLIAMKISQRTAALCGSCLFFVFAFHNYLWG